MGPKTLIRGTKARTGESKSRFTEIMEKRENLLDPIVTGDETWFHYYEPETKFQSSQWKRKHEGVPINVKSAASAGNGWPPYSGIEREYCQLIGFQRKLPSTAIIT